MAALCAVVALCAACGRQAEPAPATTSTGPAAAQINPARIDRSRTALPEGYEVTAYRGHPAPMALWGLREPAVSDPAPCAALAAPAVDPASAKGWSGSGPGGIAYAVVAPAASPVSLDAVLRAQCGRWTLSSGPTTAAVTGLPGPAIDAAQTVGMRTATTTVVEGGTETHSRADTFVAYLGGYICFVALVTDPGSPHPALGSGFASRLLTETVSALRG